MNEGSVSYTPGTSPRTYNLWVLGGLVIVGIFTYAYWR